MHPEMARELAGSLEQPRKLLENQMKRLSLKEKHFKTFSPAEAEEVQKMWDHCLMVDPTLKVR